MAQTKISGRVLDNKDKPLKGVSVSLNNTLDGGTTDSAGYFSFETTETGNQSLVAMDATHSTMGMPLVLTGAEVKGLILRMRVAVLDAVTITAGAFGSSVGRGVVVMSPIDIVTTAGSNGDVVKAMEMMPGTQHANTENGLFIRGGDASEASMIVDEIVVQSAFASGPPGVATRSRFSAFQYQGVSFSSGGYGARYGQALSGVLELTSTDLADKSTVNLGINMGGVYASGTKRWKNSSLDIGGNYNNLTPLYALSNALSSNNFKFNTVPQGGGANARYAWKPNKDGMFKATVSGSFNTSGISIPNPSAGVSDTSNPISHLPDTVNYTTKDTYIFGTLSYKQMFKNKYMLYTAASYSLDSTNNKFGFYPIGQREYRTQFRIEGKDFISSRVTLLAGTDIQHYGIRKTMGYDSFFHMKQQFDETVAAGYAELEWTPVYWLAIRPGVRYEHSSMLDQDVIAPRFSAAIKTGLHSQISLAGGVFYQDANNIYYLAGMRPDMQYAVHYISNWQWSRSDRTFRVEGYIKDYKNLVHETNANLDSFVSNRYRTLFAPIPFNNSGSGYAHGLEIFWRDKKSIKNADYWISYSYIDTKRMYENFPAFGTPTFIATHNLNVVGKYFVEKWQTNFSATYSYASGYPYYDPTLPKTNSNFLSEKTPAFNNVALTIAYLHTFGKWFAVFYLSADNVLNTNNVYGYRFAYDSNGVAIKNSKSEIVSALKQVIFVGANFSLTKFSKDEL